MTVAINPYTMQFGLPHANYKIVQFVNLNKFRIQWSINAGESWRWSLNENLEIFQATNIESVTDRRNILAGVDITHEHWEDITPKVDKPTEDKKTDEGDE